MLNLSARRVACLPFAWLTACLRLVMHHRCSTDALGRRDIEEFAQPGAWAQGAAKGLGQSESSRVPVRRAIGGSKADVVEAAICRGWAGSAGDLCRFRCKPISDSIACRSPWSERAGALENLLYRTSSSMLAEVP